MFYLMFSMFVMGEFGFIKDLRVGSYVTFYNNVSNLEKVIVLVIFNFWIRFFEIFYN